MKAKEGEDIHMFADDCRWCFNYDTFKQKHKILCKNPQAQNNCISGNYE